MDYNFMKNNNDKLNTKNICIYSFISMLLITLFIISPLSNITGLSTIMKIIAIFILIYVIYLNLRQIYFLQKIDKYTKNNEYNRQLQINIISSYMLSLFLVILAFYTIKNIFE